jgi:methylamine dehydrogenase accessory protein MauD
LMTSAGAVVGDKIPVFDLKTINGNDVRIGGSRSDGRSTLIAFIAPDCPVCSSLVPIYTRIAKSERDRLQLIFASDESVAGHESYRRKMGIEPFPYVLSTELGIRFEIGKLPYAVLLDAEGVVASQGLVNSREHIESLLEAQRLNLGSIQDFFELEHARPKLEAHA